MQDQMITFTIPVEEKESSVLAMAALFTDGRLEEYRKQFSTHVLVSTPREVRALQEALGQLGKSRNAQNRFGFAEILVFPPDNYVSFENIVRQGATDSVGELVEIIGSRKFAIFDEQTLDAEINRYAGREMAALLSPHNGIFLGERGRAFDEASFADQASLAAHDPALLLDGLKGSPVTPEVAIGWLLENWNFILGVEEQKTLFEIGRGSLMEIWHGEDDDFTGIVENARQALPDDEFEANRTALRRLFQGQEGCRNSTTFRRWR